MSWYVYIVRCSDDSLYTGISNDWYSRIEKHNSGRGAKYTKKRLPVVLAHLEEVESKSDALKREYAIKQFSKKEKEELVLYSGMGEYGQRFDFAIKEPTSNLRDRVVQKFSWAIPNEEALRTIIMFSPVVEIGAGNGYWASLLRHRGCDLVAFDQSPPGEIGETIINPWQTRSFPFTKVLQGTPKDLKIYSDRTLFVSWPTAGSMMEDCLRIWHGEFLILIGEQRLFECEAFYEQLESEFVPVRKVNIPQWPAINDNLVVWRRR